MPKTPKTQGEPTGNATDGSSDVSAWDKDQKRRQYYYDDAYGYETYQDDETDEERSDAIVPKEPGVNE